MFCLHTLMRINQYIPIHPPATKHVTVIDNFNTLRVASACYCFHISHTKVVCRYCRGAVVTDHHHHPQVQIKQAKLWPACAGILLPRALRQQLMMNTPHEAFKQLFDSYSIGILSRSIYPPSSCIQNRYITPPHSIRY